MMRRSDILLAEKTLLYTRERVLLLGLFCFFLLISTISISQTILFFYSDYIDT